MSVHHQGPNTNRTLDIRVTSCAGCRRTVTLVGSGVELGDFEWLCPYKDSNCTQQSVLQQTRQMRGPLQAVVKGLFNRSAG